MVNQRIINNDGTFCRFCPRLFTRINRRAACPLSTSRTAGFETLENRKAENRLRSRFSSANTRGRLVAKCRSRRCNLPHGFLYAARKILNIQYGINGTYSAARAVNNFLNSTPIKNFATRACLKSLLMAKMRTHFFNDGRCTNFPLDRGAPLRRVAPLPHL